MYSTQEFTLDGKRKNDLPLIHNPPTHLLQPTRQQLEQPEYFIQLARGW